ncbi:MAG: DUF1566 domain-containing protein, partial [bacterium]
PPPAEPAPVAPPPDLAAQAWNIIEPSTDPAVFQAFVERFPDAPQRQLAELKLMVLPKASIEKTDSLDTKPSGTAQQTDSNAEAEKVVGIDGFVVEGQITTDEETGLTWQREQVWHSWEEANRYCQTEHYGLSDWRLPKEAELAFLYQRLDASKNRMTATKIFPSLMRDHYWSGEGVAGSAWSVNFKDGNRSWRPKSGIAYVRCVRGSGVPDSMASETVNLYSSKPSQTELSDSGSNSRYSWAAETVEDKRKNLIWQRQDDGTPRTQVDAEKYCQDLELGGWDDWMLPQIGQLRSLIEEDLRPARINRNIFPVRYQNFATYWSETPAGVDAGQRWFIDFLTGKTHTASKTNYGFTLCIRSNDAGTQSSNMASVS